VAAWRLTFATLVLAPFALATRRAEWRTLSRREWGWLGAAGVVLAFHFYAWITSLALTSVAASVVLVTTNPIFVGIISHFVLKERLTRSMIIGMAIAFTGAVLIGLGDMDGRPNQWLGDVLALGGAVAVAAYMLIGRRLRARLSLLGYMVPVYAGAAITLLIMAVLTGTPLTGYPPQMWQWLLLLALLPQVIGHTALNWALGHLPATYVALAVLAEPIGSAALAMWILKETPSPVVLVGSVLILTGLVLANRRKE